jgi:hypothetical protein
MRLLLISMLVGCGGISASAIPDAYDSGPAWSCGLEGDPCCDWKCGDGLSCVVARCEVVDAAVGG